jgi:branched-chain amino acid transport system ATP-binding protein
MAVVTSLADQLRNTQVDLPAGTPVLAVESLRLSFGAVRAIDGVSFTVDDGELFAIIGPNGAGKTSVFNCLSGVYHPQEGQVRFLGEDVLGRKPHAIAAMGMARTFQNIELFENLTVLDNLMLGRHQHLTYRSGRAMLWWGRAKHEELEARRIVEDIVDFLEIVPYRKSIVSMLPYGIQKRVELGRALAMEPKLLLLDEPVAGMNLEETEDMARFILDIREELGIATILVDHDMGVVMDLAERVLVMDFGRAISLGSPDEIQADPEVIRAYLGAEAAEEEIEAMLLDTEEASG